ncbi:hypothetical protein V6N13_080426 [Hibiscus sabdariffa]
MFMNLRILSWNVQGCGDPRFITAAKQFLRDYKPNVILFVEPRISGRRADSVIAALGFPNSHRIEAAGFSGGIWVACPSASGRKLLWPHLRRIADSMRSPWVLFGDFNSTLKAIDRKGCALSSKPSRDFQNLLLDYGLRDMGYQGPDFTWSPILLQVGHVLNRRSSNPFRYISAWLSHEDFDRMVSDNWHITSSMAGTISNFILATDSWNKLVFGYIGTKKRILMARLRGIQKALASRSSRFLHNLES